MRPTYLLYKSWDDVPNYFIDEDSFFSSFDEYIDRDIIEPMLSFSKVVVRVGGEVKRMISLGPPKGTAPNEKDPIQ